jgi:hypothetical protein
MVASGNTLYVVTNTNPTFLQEINGTTGAIHTAFLNLPITDMTVAITETSQIPEPNTLMLFGTALLTLGGIGYLKRRRDEYEV